MNSFKCFLYFITLVIISIFSNGCKDKEIVHQEVSPVEYQQMPFDSFLFVGASNKVPSLYKYYPADQKIEEFWRSDKEKVIELSSSPDRSSSFFITGSKTGMKGIFPYINNVKLYVINDDSVVTFIQDAGDVIHVFTKWETNNAFRIFINRMDPGNPSKIFQTIRIYNTYGKLFEEEEKTFDLLTDGYPQPQRDDVELISQFNEYMISVKEGSPDSLFFIFKESDEPVFITTTGKQVNSVAWSPDLLNVIIELIDKGIDQTGADLILFSIQSRKIVKAWKGNTPGSYFLVNNYLVTDIGRVNKSFIVIYDLEKQKEIVDLKMKGGCSLKSIFN